MTPGKLVALAAIALMVAIAGCDGGDDPPSPTTATVETIAGGNLADGGPATEAPVAAWTIAVAPNGDVYLADHGRVRRIDAATGRIASIAGSDDPSVCTGDGPPDSTCLGDIAAVAVDRRGNVFASDPFGEAVVRIDPTTGAHALVAAVELPGPLATNAGGDLFVTSQDEGLVLRIDAATQEITAFAGDGDSESSPSECPLDVAATATCVGSPFLAVDRDGALLLTSDYPFLRRVDPTTGILAALAVSSGRVAIGPDGDLIISRRMEDRVVRYDPDTGRTSTLVAGTPDAPLLPGAVAVDAGGGILLQTGAFRLVRFDASGHNREIIAGNGNAEDCGDGGLAKDACLGAMNDVDVAPNGDVLIAERSGRLRTIAANSGRITTFADVSESPACGVSRIAAAPNGDAVVGDFEAVCRVDRRSGATTVIVAGTACSDLGDPIPHEGDPALAACVFVADLFVESDGSLLIADSFRRRLWRIAPDTGRLSIVAGAPTEAPLQPPCGDGGPARDACLLPIRVAEDTAGNIYVLDASAGGTSVRRIDAATGTITTVARFGFADSCGQAEASPDACYVPSSLQVDPSGNVLVGGSNGMRHVDVTTGTVTPVATDPALFDVSLDAIDREGRPLFFREESAPRLRRIRLPPS